MKFEARLNLKFYISSLFLLGLVAFGWYGLYFLNANEILMDDAPMDRETKMFFSAVIFLVISSWTLSLFTVFRQWLSGLAFYMDNEGIGSTATAVNIFTFIFIVPIRKIPYSAIKRISQENGMLILHINKNNVDIIPLLRIFVRTKYHLFYSFTSASNDEITAELKKHIPDIEIEKSIFDLD